MNWKEELAVRLEGLEQWGYSPAGPTFSEPTALACLALASLQREGAARKAGERLANIQSSSGAVGIYEGQDQPGWPTGWALQAWQCLQPAGDERLRSAISRGVAWLLELRGETLTPSDILGHDVTLVGWPWVSGTHSWIEPTAIAILGLRAVGQGNHVRVQEAEDLLMNRQLPGGGCNYGNTIVLDQKLLAHAQPTGLALMALAQPALIDQPPVRQSVAFLVQQWPRLTGVSSICYAAIGLTAHGQRPANLEARCHELYQQLLQRRTASAYTLALIALATADPVILT